MRYAILADIHANLEALHAVLIDAKVQRVERFVCLGDVVGYNANPGECLELLRELDCPVVRGNHDEHAARPHQPNFFNPNAERAIQWTRNHLSDEQKEWLRGLKYVEELEGFTIVHATLDRPQDWGYIFENLDASRSFQFQRTPLCFYGHTHAPRVYVQNGSVKSQPLGKVFLEQGKKYLINVGSVGQPRDGDPRAAYGIYDTEKRTVELRRLSYDIQTARKKIVEAGLWSAKG